MVTKIYRPRIPAVLDPATDIPVCAKCYADISHKPTYARFCSYECKQRYKAKRQRQEAGGRKVRTLWLG